MGQVKFSLSNKKMGNITSVSLPSLLTCVKCECNKKCYAQKLERLRPSVKNAYMHNLNVLHSDPDTYWREVEAQLMLNHFFRFHVSGDIPNCEYFESMVNACRRQGHCQVLCFTKRYGIVNTYIQSHEDGLPDNLHIIFSAWRNYPMDNQYHLPEAHVLYRDGTTTASKDALLCGGNCTACAVTDGGCWTLQNGQEVVFNEH